MTMKKLFFSLFVASFSMSTAAQSAKPRILETPGAVHKLAYEGAKKRGDAMTAIVSLNYLLSTGGSASYADTLAQWYLYSEQYVQAKLLSEELLAKRPQDETLLAIKGTSLRALNQTTEAVEVYGKLFQLTRNYLYGVELVQLQWSLKRLLECQQTAQSLRSLTYKPEQTLQVPTPDNKSQEPVAVPAFAWYMEGISYLGGNQTEKAKEAFQKALAITNPFSLASFQLGEIEKLATTVKN